MVDLCIKICIKILYRIISWLDCLEFGKIPQENQVIYNIPLPDGIEVETDTGYRPVTNFIYKIPFQVYRITLTNGYTLEGADKHIVYRGKFKYGMEQCYLDELTTKDFIYTDKGFKRVRSIEVLPYKLCMCDISVDYIDHRFYSNGILSHNSVTTGIYVLWKTIFNVDNNALILSKSGQAGVDLVKKVKDMYLYLPYHLKCGTIKWNQSEVSLDNNSSFRTEAFGPTAGVGSTINTLVLDEFAWCPPNDVELFYENVIPTVTTMPNSNVCIMSTQNGFNKFYQIYNGAITGKNIYAPYKTDWYQVPNFNPETKEWEPRTEEWKDMMIGVLGSEEAFYYQYGTQFLSSDKCIISREKMSQLKEKMRLFKNREQELDNIVMINPKNLYWDPDFDIENLRKNYYIICIDLAEGGGNDYTCFQILEVIEKDKFKQVGRYYSNQTSIEQTALDLWMMCPQLFTEDHYIISIELNTYGWLFYNYLIMLNDDTYKPEYIIRFDYAEEFDTSNIVHYKKGSQEEVGQGYKSSSNMVPGIKITHNNKITGCTLMKMMIEKDDIEIIDTITVCEFENFEDKNGNGSYSASFGHDDTVMPFIQLPIMKNTPKYKNFMEEFESNEQVEEVSMYGGSFDYYGGGNGTAFG